ncbi:NAD(P)-dependent glycerol-3-phosphate dehydrogenase [Acidaminococcus sp. NSJ-142]|jgi:glycerol-3-phosphate dehydrogenase (NAD(P)+)|uniref:NAD(P)H-dependent glycerol-3-phosphate dehydrogenase n=1 Tax=Acidaminococcus TaxID=904 RepID=UPI000CF89A8F|nr:MULTISPECIES: NAD(P)H-dependent glycerol-3-phosphate dehydrogenase [Acidaminococcus]MCD2435577.1 NAD(P)-dependent glycerol-3-phosphate dehydrogenase [Acidaminococcus hominis]MCH4095657.1 NAD(P)-dependent glycerol-3-phosphate dehydrogenase [Acidaminococcus provencensis]RHK01441.1 NAD(P)-dependent glycerol-3-phosphate dehydrogenase [Acidaminococcus sp. AM05-11]
MKIAVIGAGSWGTVLAQILADNGHEVCLWARNPQKADQIQRTRRNQDYLPDLELSPSILVTHDLQQTIERASVLVFVVPSKGMAAVAQQAAAFTDCREQILLSCTKGFDLATGKLMTDILEETFPQAKAVAALSGPNLAKEIAKRQPAASVIACKDLKIAKALQKIFINGYFRPYTSRDVIGVELCGCSKNCIALVSGILAGLGFGENSQAGLITRGLAEITRLGVKMGAKRATFSGLAGVGDLVATCSSPLSRNRSAGVALAQGKSLEEITQGTHMVIEGINAAPVVRQLALAHGVEMPIIEQLYQVLFAKKSVEIAIADLMKRVAKKE